MKANVSPPKVRSLLVRPFQSADLSFGVSGVLTGASTTKSLLGARITKEDTASYNKVLEKLSECDSSDPSQLVFGSEKIQTFLGDHFTFSLRNEMIATNLEQALHRRRIAFLQKFAHKSEIVKQYRVLYPDSPDSIDDLSDIDANNPISALGKLEALNKAVSEKYVNLINEYRNEEEDITKHTVNTAIPKGTFESKVSALGHPIYSAQPKTISQANTTIAEGGKTQTITHGAVTVADQEQHYLWKDLSPGKMMQSTKTTYGEELFSTKTDVGLPKFLDRKRETVMEYLSQKLRIDQEHLDEFVFSLGVPSLGTIMDSELKLLDLEIRRAQIQYVNSFLLPTITGRVTAVYKDVGESVKAGEAVMRIENDSQLLLVGKVNYRGLLRLDEPDANGSVTVESSSVFESGESVRIDNAKIVGIRGHDKDNDEWDIILQCENPVNKGVPSLPINYQFDRENTTITFGE